MQVQLEYETSIALSEAFCFTVDTKEASSDRIAAAVGLVLQPKLRTTSSNSLASLKILSSTLTHCAEKFRELLIGASLLGGNRESGGSHGAGLHLSSGLFFSLASFDPHRLFPIVPDLLSDVFRGSSHTHSHRHIFPPTIIHASGGTVSISRPCVSSADRGPRT
jgi:hypothetical protein